MDNLLATRDSLSSAVEAYDGIRHEEAQKMPEQPRYQPTDDYLRGRRDGYIGREFRGSSFEYLKGYREATYRQRVSQRADADPAPAELSQASVRR